ncbi:Inactive protein RESTRICTED TEV MOVEMENT 1, partial [Bienertia sinuspersici]
DDFHCPQEEEATISMLKLGPIPSLDDVNPSVNDESKEEILIWDEKGRSKLTQMFISYDTDNVMFMDGGDTEYITAVSGSHGIRNYVTRARRLTSLTIETNKGTYGPFGSTKIEFNDKKFQFSLGHSDQFGGFHGTSSPSFLTSIGVYLKPIQDLGSLCKKNDLHID